MKILKNHFLYFAIIASFYFVFKTFSLECPFKAITGYPCPTCGMTRSIYALLRLDFRQSFEIFPMLLPITAALLAAFHLKMFKHKKMMGFAIILIAILNLAIYFLHIL